VIAKAQKIHFCVFAVIYPPSQKTTGVNPWMNATRCFGEMSPSHGEGGPRRREAAAGFEAPRL
jgi:hypothetical protein